MKPWYLSKVIWFNVIMTVLDIVALVETFVPQEAVVIFAIIHGVGNIILRRWFTSTQII